MGVILMKFNFKRCFVILFCMVLLFAGLPETPKIHAESTTGKQLSGITTLTKDKTYNYDLDGDGKTDKIMFQSTENENDYSVSFNLYINDKLCNSQKTQGFCCNIQICDLDTSDTYLDLFITTIGYSDGILYSSFVRYNGKTVSIVSDLAKKVPKEFDLYRYGLNKVNGDGTFIITADTPYYSDAIGCYYCDIPFQLKDNKLSFISTDIFTLNKCSSTYKYKAKKNFSVYKNTSSKQVLFQVKKGNKVTFDQLYVAKSGKVYLKLRNSKGKTGWILATTKNLFSNCNYWG